MIGVGLLRYDYRLEGMLYQCISSMLVNPIEFNLDRIRECNLFFKKARIQSSNLHLILDKLIYFTLLILDGVGLDKVEEDYISLFELAPKCPPYIGYYAYRDERERRKFMVELAEYYRRFGLKMRPVELPDYIPAMIEFLGLTTGGDKRLRIHFIKNYIKPYIDEFIDCIGDENYMYHELYMIFRILVDMELSSGFNDVG